MLAQCADAYHFLTLNGFQDKFPNMRTCFAHGGQLAQINLGRRIQGFDGRPDLFEGKSHPRKAVGHENIFFDTLVHDTGGLELLIKNQGYKQVLMGLDDPYPLGEMESEKQSSYPGKILDLAIERKIITENQRDAIWEDNVIQWLCGNNEISKQTFINRILSWMNFLPDALDEYVIKNSQKEPKLLTQLHKETYQKILQPRMVSGHYQGRLLSMISKLINPKTILEIGTYTGYSALCLAEGLQDCGELHTIDINEELVDFSA